jgi:hypothetical protein
VTFFDLSLHEIEKNQAFQKWLILDSPQKRLNVLIELCHV